MHFVIRLIVNVIALVCVAYLVPGIHYSWPMVIVAALVLGVVNAIIRPILILLSLPLEILTLGLFTFVINALLFWFVGHLGIGLTVDGFGAAFIGAIILTIVSWVLSLLLSGLAAA